MKVLIVLAAIVVVAYANAVGRAGWGSGSPLLTADLELAAAVAAAASGQASAGQQLIEAASGTADSPASISSLSGVQAVGLSQIEGINQAQVLNKPNGAASTINDVLVDNQSNAVDLLQASLSGGNSASVQNSGETETNGEASSAADAVSYNSIQQQ